MSDQWHKDKTWNVSHPNQQPTMEGAQLAVLMDIRDELHRLNAVFACPNFLEVPRLLREIRKHTRPKPKPKV